MPELISNTTQAVVNAQKLVTVAQENVGKAKVQGAHKVNQIVSYDGRTGSVTVTSNRAADPFLTSLVNKSTTVASAADVIKVGLTYLQSFITDQSGSTKTSKLANEVTNFIKNANQLSIEPTPSLKQAFVRQGEKLASTLSEATTKILDLRLEADEDLSNSLIEVNNILFDLLDTNVSLNSGSSDSSLLDRRDSLTNKLSEYLDIKVSEGANGNALISTVNGSLNLVDSLGYGKFSYNNIVSKETFLEDKPSINPVMMNRVDKHGNMGGDFEAINGDDPRITKITGGKISGYIQLRDDKLFTAGETVKTLASQVYNNVNAAHNKYSPFPPKTTLISNKKALFSDSIGWSGKLNIVAIDKTTGNSLIGNGNSGAVRPITIDLSTLPTSSANGSPTMLEMVNEINEYLGNGPAQNRVALGVIPETPLVPGPLAPTYLLNNIKMVGTTDIGTAGNFSFDLELNGSQYFGSKVQILSVNGPAGLSANLPPIFDLSKGEHTRTNQRIDVAGIVGGAQNVDVRIRVTGDNGVIEEGVVRFAIDPTIPNGTQMLNKRVAGIANGGTMVDTNNITHAPIAIAKLVDEKGNNIDPNTNGRGRLVIEAYNNDNGLVISSDLDNTPGGFSNFFGINNFFIEGLIPGTFDVEQAIKDDSSLVSVGAVTAGKSLQTVSVGDGAPATIDVNFNGAAINGGTTVNINYGTTFKVFTFGPNPGQIAIVAANLPATMQNLVDAINNDPNIAILVKARVNNGIPVDGVIVDAVAAGTSSNAIRFASNIPTVINGNNAPANIPVNFAGGADINVATEKYELKIGPSEASFFKDIEDLNRNILNFGGNDFVSANTNTLTGYANFITELLSNQLNVAKTEADVTKVVKNDFEKQLKSLVGIDEKQAFLTLMDYVQSQSMSTAIKSIINRLMKEAIENTRQS